MLSRLNRETYRLTGGRMGALGVLFFLSCLAFLAGLLLELFFGAPTTPRPIS